MRVDHAGRGIEPRIRDPEHADSAIVPGNVLQQPLDRVVGVAALVDVGRLPFVGNVRRDLFELPFRQEPPADVLIDKDVPGFDEVLARSQRCRELVDAVRCHGIRRALDQNGYVFVVSRGKYTAVNSLTPSRIGIRCSCFV